MNPVNEIDYGSGCLGIIWENIATRIVNEAIRVYNATPEQAAAAAGRRRGNVHVYRMSDIKGDYHFT